MSGKKERNNKRGEEETILNISGYINQVSSTLHLLNLILLGDDGIAVDLWDGKICGASQ